MGEARKILEKKGLTKEQVEAGVNIMRTSADTSGLLKSSLEVPEASERAEGGIPWLTTRREYRSG